MRRVLPHLCMLLLLVSSAAQACSCVNRTAEQKYRDAEFVFIGRPTSITAIRSRSAMPGWPGVSATFGVERQLKNNISHILALETGEGRGDCGVPLLVGSAYIFFVTRTGEINICSGTQAYLAGYPSDELVLRYLEELATPKK